MIQFGVGDLTVSGHAFARLHTLNLNITYDNYVYRGGKRVFPDACVLYNGNIEGTFENGELDISGIGDMLGADQAATAITLSTTHAITTGLDLKYSGITNGVSCTVTLFNCFFPSLTLGFDRENALVPSTNFIVAGETSASGGRVIKIET